MADNLSSGNLKNLANASGHARFVEADVTEPAMPEVVAKARPEILYHLAGQSAIRRSVIDPLFDAHVNLLGTIQVATAALQAGCQRLVFASSGGRLRRAQPSRPADRRDIPAADDHSAARSLGDTERRGVPG